MMSLSSRFRSLALPLARRLSTAPEPRKQRLFAKLGGAGLACAGMQYFFGSEEDFYDYRFITRKEPIDIVDFYGTEDFMQLFCVFPFVEKLMMRYTTFDDEGVAHAWGLPGEMLVSMDFTECEEEFYPDGETPADTLAWFNKREEFKNVGYFTRVVLWNMVQNFGYFRLSDGTCEVYHHGEHFYGPFPIRLLFQIHARYVGWATERHINSEAFGSEDEEKTNVAEAQRHNMPLTAVKDLMVHLTRDVEKALEHQKATAQSTAEHEKTLEKLKEYSGAAAESTVSVAKATRTLTRRGTVVKTVRVSADDAEVQRTIKKALTLRRAHLTRKGTVL